MKEEIGRITRQMERQGYVADRAIATAVHLAQRLGKPLLVEGEAGVGKTEIAKVLAAILDTELIRLQCYEGLDVHTALSSSPSRGSSARPAGARPSARDYQVSD